MKYGRISLNLSLFYHTLQFLSNDKYEYDIILCHFGPIGDLAVKLREISAIKGKVVTVFHGSDITRLIIENGKDYYNDLFEKGDLFLPISENFANKLKQLGCPKEKIIVHRMAINVDKFIYRLPLYTDDKPLKIISVARLVEKKGIEFSVEAVIAALEENVNIEYKIIGDGPLKDKIFKLIEIHGFKDKIRLLGWKNQEEIVDILNNEADLFLVPSVTAVNGDQEGLPVVIMEALAIGLPVIATNHSGIPEIIENNVTGYIVPERDVKALKDMITKVQNDYSFVRAMTLNGRNLVEKEYNIKLQNERLKNIFEDLLSV
jgi:colanic acid/amylovoran biosynthesis glycosyltransferase